MSRTEGSELQAIEDLAAALDGGETATSHEELSELLVLAHALEDVPTATPDPGFRRSLRATIVREASELLPVHATPAPESVRAKVARWRRSASLAIASALSATAIGGAGLAVAADHALPDDALYGVKRGVESLRLAVAGSEADRGRLQLDFAQRRLDEVTAGARTIAPGRLVDTLEAMDAASTGGAGALLDVYDVTGDTATLQRVATFVERQRSGLNQILPQLPVEVVPFAQDSLELIRRIEIEAGAIALSGCVPCLEGPVSITDPAEGPAISRVPCCDQADAPGPAGPVSTGDPSSDSGDGGTNEEPAPGTATGSATSPTTTEGPTTVPSVGVPTETPELPLPSVSIPVPSVDPTDILDDPTEILDDPTELLDDTVDDAGEILLGE